MWILHLQGSAGFPPTSEELYGGGSNSLPIHHLFVIDDKFVELDLNPGLHEL